MLILGAGPTGICTMLCAMLHHPHRIIICDPDPARLRFVREHYPDVLTITPEHAQEFVQLNSPHGGADVAEQYEKREQAARVFSYINALEEPHRSLMALRLVNELPFGKSVPCCKEQKTGRV